MPWRRPSRHNAPPGGLVRRREPEWVGERTNERAIARRHRSEKNQRSATEQTQPRAPPRDSVVERKLAVRTPPERVPVPSGECRRSARRGKRSCRNGWHRVGGLGSGWSGPVPAAFVVVHSRSRREHQLLRRRHPSPESSGRRHETNRRDRWTRAFPENETRGEGVPRSTRSETKRNRLARATESPCAFVVAGTRSFRNHFVSEARAGETRRDWPCVDLPGKLETKEFRSGRKWILPPQPLLNFLITCNDVLRRRLVQSFRLPSVFGAFVEGRAGQTGRDLHRFTRETVKTANSTVSFGEDADSFLSLKYY
mmetsp:Transcript_15860/g.36170  ORF Transcript_15860/g.36170 Transcript_15860/m.36170 type:complete len:311 (-) Transcript_15860:933-1865(-)